MPDHPPEPKKRPLPEPTLSVYFNQFSGNRFSYARTGIRLLGDDLQEQISFAKELGNDLRNAETKFPLLYQLFPSTSGDLREAVLKSLRVLLLPWIRVCISRDPYCLVVPKSLIPWPDEVWHFLENIGRDPRVTEEVRLNALEALDRCDSGKRSATYRKEMSHWEEIQVATTVKLRNKHVFTKVQFCGHLVHKELLDFKFHKSESGPDGVTLRVWGGTSNGVLRTFSSEENLNTWKNKLELFKETIGDCISRLSKKELVKKIDAFESSLNSHRSAESEDSPSLSIDLSKTSTPVPQNFVDPLRPYSETYGMAEFDYE